jgi:hypothetical protein
MDDKPRGFGRFREFDEKSRRFGIAELVPTKKPRSYTWSVDPSLALDQGTEGACVGFAWTHELIARPRAYVFSSTQFADMLARHLYAEAKKLDAWPGEDYDGTSILAGAKAAKAGGHIGEYRWAFSLRDAILAIGYAGPVVFGCDWYRGMMDPEPDGRIRPMGPLLGGHAIMANAVDVKRERVWLWQSWGPDWGPLGARSYLTFEDFAGLQADGGEVCVPLLRKRQPK